MRTLRDQTITDEQVVLNDLIAERVTFDGCILELWKSTGANLIDCTIINCDLRGDGWPADVIAGIALAKLRPDKATGLWKFTQNPN